MSLINDALNRAKAEATHREADPLDDVAPPALPSRLGRPRRSLRSWLPAILAATLGILVFLRFEAGSGLQPATDSKQEQTGLDVAEPATALAGVEPASTRGDAGPVGEPVRPKSEPSLPSPVPEPAAAPETRPRADEAPARKVPAVSDAPPRPAAESRDSPVQSAEVQPPEATPPARVESAPETSTERAPTVPTSVWADGPDEEETWFYVGQVDLPGGGTVELGGIVWSSTAPSAMLNGSLMSEGDEILGLRLAEISPRSVTLIGQGRRVTVQLAPSESYQD